MNENVANFFIMANEERVIQKYIEEKKELHKLVLQIIEKSDDFDSDTNFNTLHVFVSIYQYERNKGEIMHFF